MQNNFYIRKISFINVLSKKRDIIETESLTQRETICEIFHICSKTSNTHLTFKCDFWQLGWERDNCLICASFDVLKYQHRHVNKHHSVYRSLAKKTDVIYTSLILYFDQLKVMTISYSMYKFVMQWLRKKFVVLKSTFCVNFYKVFELRNVWLSTRACLRGQLIRLNTKGGAKICTIYDHIQCNRPYIIWTSCRSSPCHQSWDSRQILNNKESISRDFRVTSHLLTL